MADNAVNKSITIDMDDDEETPQVNNFSEALKEMGNTLLVRHPEKTTNISNENANGIVRVKVLNDYMERNFGYRYQALDKLVDGKRENVVSVKGWGMDKFIESVKSIQASFEQTQLPDGTIGRLRGR